MREFRDTVSTNICYICPHSVTKIGVLLNFKFTTLSPPFNLFYYCSLTLIIVFSVWFTIRQRLLVISVKWSHLSVSFRDK